MAVQLSVLWNGRRKTIKTSANTSILEILDEACKNNGLDSCEWDLRHHKTILDVSSTVRFSSLPQNAQLELIQAKIPRVETSVTLCLQLESGERLEGQFPSTTSLWDLLQQLTPTTMEIIAHPAVIYMRRVISGKESLSNTSLRLIGLTGGRAILKLVDKAVEELSVQANVSAPLSRPAASIEEVASNIPQAESIKPRLINLTPMETDNATQKDCDSEVQELDAVSETSAAISQHSITAQSCGETYPSSTRDEDSMHINEEDDSNSIIVPERIALPGERNAVIYNLDSIPPTKSEDYPDDFYELTVSDVRHLAAEASRALRELEDAPLLTAEQRKLDRDGLILQKLNYKACLIRIRFPDRTVLQGCFKPIDTVAQVKLFVKEHLQDPDLQFYLYVTPPKRVLEDNVRLVEVDCVPSAVLYISVTSSGDNETDQQVLLRNDLLSKFSSHHEAFHLAKQLRGSENNPVADKTLSKGPTIPKDRARPGPSVPSSSSSSTNKVPKWFKSSK